MEIIVAQNVLHLQFMHATNSMPPGPRLRGLRSLAAFTLVETVMSVAVISVFLTLGYATLLLSNRQAMANRLYTLAEEMARDQIDRLQTAAPYNPQFPAPLGPQIPAELTLDSARGGPSIQTLPLYTDPSNGNVVINAQLTTSVTDVGSFNTRAAQVTVSYAFGSRVYQVRMNTLRTSDS